MRTAVFRLLFARRIHGTPNRFRERLLTGANVLTVARALGTSAIMLAAIVEQSPPLLLAGLIASWGLDIADGQLARWRKRESVLGAQLDILADRATAMWVVLGVVVFGQASALTVCAGAAVWIQLSFFDQLLASQFLRFGHWSPDEFHLEDPFVWRLNWAPAAKVLGNVPLALLVIGGPLLWPALVLALLLAAIRVVSYLRMEQRAGIEGRYDPETDEACFRLDGCGAPAWLDDGIERLLDGEGRVVAIRYREAVRRLPAGLLALLPPRRPSDSEVVKPGAGNEQADPQRGQLETFHPHRGDAPSEPATSLEAA